METRSKVKNQLDQINIDFDEASECWRKNKKSIGNGCYKYICIRETKTGNNCKRKPEKYSDFCKIHQNKEINLS